MVRARALLVGAALVVALGLAGCGSDSSSSAPSDCTKIVDGKVTLVARDLQWNTKCLEGSRGKIAFTVKLEDDGVKHDLQVYGQGINEQTPLTAGPATLHLDVTLPKPGHYQFACTIHAQMEGDLYVDAAKT
jgi:plastocyanin